MPAAAAVEIVAGSTSRSMAVPPQGLVVGRNLDEMRRVCGKLPDGSYLVLDNSSVSKVHARILWQGEDLLVEDGYLNDTRQPVRSRNGVHRNGQVLLQAHLTDGDELVLGDVVLRVGIVGARFGLPASSFNDTGSTLKPSPPEATGSHERRAADMLPIVESLFQSVDVDDLGRRVADAVKAHLKPSRVAVLEFEPDTDRMRVLGLAGAESPSFISRSVVDEAIKRDVALHRDGSAARPLVASMLQAGATSALGVVIRPRNQKLRALYVDTLLGTPHLTWTHALEVQLIAAHAAAAFDSLDTQREIAEQRLRFEHLRRFFAPNVVEHLLKNPEAAEVAHTVNATVLFADLAAYTALSEQLSDRLEHLVALLNRWLDGASRCVFANGGTLDKFIGDGVMAVFGAPFPMADAPLAAVKCALEMNEAIQRIAEETGEKLTITVGINTGAMIAGSVGSKRRLEFTVLGDTVNVAARLQSSAERGHILIGQATAEALDPAVVEVLSVGDLALKNRKVPVKAFRVVRLKG